MTKIHNVKFIAIFSILLLCSGSFSDLIFAEIVVNDPHLKIDLVATGLNSPTSMAFLGMNDILVTEKGGKVQRIVGNKTHVGNTALDLTPIIDSRQERGLLSMAISNYAKGKSENDINDPSRVKNEPKIYLYYTEGMNSKDVNSSCENNSCNINYAVNSLDRYAFRDGHIVNGTHLIKIPLDKNNPAFQHIGGTIRLDPDKNIYITSGDGRPCYNYDDCKAAVKGGLLASLTANSKNGSAPIGAGGILFVSSEGEEVDKKGILGEQYPLNLYYAYGIRNSFGIDFDPVTGNLWDTENGPFYGDEINLVQPGFNSGWAKIQGEWPIQNYSELIIDSPGGKGHPPTSYELKNKDETLSHFNSNGKYSQPEFTWNHSVGVTSIKFYNSEKLGEEYENDLFVATFLEGGRIYHFDLDNDRKNLKLKGDLKDRVAGNQSELFDVFFARGFGSITDLEVGPDGFLYVLSIGKGAIYRITPKYTN